MSIGQDPSLRDLNDCGCCDGVAVATPVARHNRPGLRAVAYRLGTYSRFVDSMLARLSAADHPALRALRTRAEDDLTIALLHACAAVDDVLTFYQERFINEAFLPTATERRSLVELARLIGYTPKPGVAAGAYLAFTIQTTPGTPEKTTIPAATRVQSVPGPDELPQTFETMEAMEARAEWNAMQLRSRQPQTIDSEMTEVVIQGLEAGIKRGDRLLIVPPGHPEERAVKVVQKVTPDPVGQSTNLRLGPAPAPTAAGYEWTLGTPFTDIIAQSMLTTGAIGSTFGEGIFSQSDLYSYTLTQNWNPIHLAYALNQPPKPPAPEPQEGIFALRRRAAVFGHNAPSWADLPQVVQGRNNLVPGKLFSTLTDAERANAQFPDSWDGLSVDAATPATDAVDLDNLYPAMIAGGWVVLESPDQEAAAYPVSANQELSRSDYALSAKVTRLSLSVDTEDTQLSAFTMRDTTVYGESEQLTLATVPVTGPVSGPVMTLDGFYPGLTAGRAVILTGERADLDGVVDSEVLTIKEVLVDGVLEPGRYFTRLVFDAAPAGSYVLETVRINANVVLATHGERKQEVLGSGDGRTAFPTFALKEKPLTYTSAETPSGIKSSLEVWVDNLRWQEVDHLYGRGEDERVYAVDVADDQTTRIQFAGRLPSGEENVHARYRIGVGLDGMVHAEQLTLLAVRPLGVRSVVNPLAASGAEDPESRDALRTNLPLTVLTMDRLVSLRDYEDFARGFAGFAKAQAVVTVDGEQQGIFVTVAGAEGAVVPESSTTFKNLVKAMHRYGDPHVAFRVKSYDQRYFQVEARIAVEPDREPELVVTAVQTALRARFAFARQEFGRPVAKSDVIAVIQQTPGVKAVTVTALFLTGRDRAVNERLTAPMPTPGTSHAEATPAGLLLLDPRPIAITVIEPEE